MRRSLGGRPAGTAHTSVAAAAAAGIGRPEIARRVCPHVEQSWLSIGTLAVVRARRDVRRNITPVK